MPVNTGAAPRARGCFWWLIAFAVAVAATVFAIWPYLAFGIHRPPQDHIGLINQLTADLAAVPPGERGRPNAAADALARAVELTYQAHEEGLGLKIPREFSPKWSVSFDGPALTPQEASVLAAAQKLGLFAVLDQLAADPTVYAPIAAGQPSQLLFESLVEPHSALRQLARINGARFRAAAEGRDGAVLARAFEENVALGRAAGSRPFAGSRLIGLAILALGREDLIRALQAGRVPPEAVPALAKTLARPDLPPARFVVETERQFGLYGLDQALGWSPLKSINRDAVKNSLDELFDELGRLAEVASGAKRLGDFQAAAPRLAAIAGRSPLVASMDQVIPAILTGPELDHEERTLILRTMLAVERFRSERGALPAALAELVPAYLPALPESPRGGGLVYERSGATPAGYQVRAPGEATPARSESR